MIAFSQKNALYFPKKGVGSKAVRSFSINSSTFVGAGVPKQGSKNSV